MHFRPRFLVFYYFVTCPIRFLDMFVSVHVSSTWFPHGRIELSGSTHSAPNPQTKRLPVVKLVAQDPKLKKLVELPLVPLSELSNHLSLEGVPKTKNHDVLPPLRCSPPVWDAWERKSLERQNREISRQSSKKDNGYSQGREIWKALAKLKNKSNL